MTAMVATSCPSLEDFVLYNGLRPRRASRSAPCRRTLSRATDFDHIGPQESAPRRRTLSRTTDFDQVGLQNSAPRRRTLFRTTDFNHAGPRTLSRRTDFGQTNRARTTKQDEPTRTMPMAQTKGSSKRKETNCVVFAWRMAEDFALDAWSMLWWSLCVSSCREAQ